MNRSDSSEFNRDKEEAQKESKDIQYDLIADYSEIILDSLTDGSLLTEIPVVKTVFSIKKLLQSVTERHFRRRLDIFLEEIRNQRSSQEKVKQVQEEFKDNQDYREQVLEHVLVELDRIDAEEKAIILARLFIALVQEQINWTVFRNLCSTLERAHILALECLKNQETDTIELIYRDQSNQQSTTSVRSTIQEAVLLEASGLGFRPQIAESQDKIAVITLLGRDMLVFGIHIRLQ